MKKQLYTLVFLISLSGIVNAQNVGINTDGSTPDGDAILHIKNDASSSKDSSVVRIENEQNGANDVTIDGNGSETIDGSNTYVLEDYNQEITIISDGTNWQIISNSN